MPDLSLSIGSNINPERNLRLAIARLRAEFGSARCSTVYESEPVGFDGDNFLNLAVVITTELPLDTIITRLKNIEDLLGRDRQQPKYAGRSMDIDVLTYGQENGHDCGIELPRAEITRNAFVLCPLAELLPTEIHAPTGKSYQALWQDYDKSRQKLWPVAFDWQDQAAAPSMPT